MKHYVPRSLEALRIAAINHRRSNTAWLEKEVLQFKKLLPIAEEDMGIVEAYYRFHWPPDRDKNVLRHDLYTFLNNFRGEVDRAYRWKEQHDAKMNKYRPRTIIPLPKPPETRMTPAEQAQWELDFEKLMGRKPMIQ